MSVLLARTPEKAEAMLECNQYCFTLTDLIVALGAHKSIELVEFWLGHIKFDREEVIKVIEKMQMDGHFEFWHSIYEFTIVDVMWSLSRNRNAINFWKRHMDVPDYALAMV
jgi:hypothetical protein